VAKDSPKITDGELQTLDEYWGQKAFKKSIQTTPTSSQTVWRVS